jgi:hypothetical protein
MYGAPCIVPLSTISVRGPTSACASRFRRRVASSIVAVVGCVWMLLAVAGCSSRYILGVYWRMVKKNSSALWLSVLAKLASEHRASVSLPAAFSARGRSSPTSCGCVYPSHTLRPGSSGAQAWSPEARYLPGRVVSRVGLAQHLGLRGDAAKFCCDSGRDVCADHSVSVSALLADKRLRKSSVAQTLLAEHSFACGFCCSVPLSTISVTGPTSACASRFRRRVASSIVAVVGCVWLRLLVALGCCRLRLAVVGCARLCLADSGTRSSMSSLCRVKLSSMLTRLTHCALDPPARKLGRGKRDTAGGGEMLLLHPIQLHITEIH